MYVCTYVCVKLLKSNAMYSDCTFAPAQSQSKKMYVIVDVLSENCRLCRKSFKGSGKWGIKNISLLYHWGLRIPFLYSLYVGRRQWSPFGHLGQSSFCARLYDHLPKTKPHWHDTWISETDRKCYIFTSLSSIWVSDIIQPQAIKPYHTHNRYVTCLLHA